mgnify:CR=1 FL=1|jgi:hypothetical protein
MIMKSKKRVHIYSMMEKRKLISLECLFHEYWETEIIKNVIYHSWCDRAGKRKFMYHIVISSESLFHEYWETKNKNKLNNKIKKTK